MRPRWPPEEDTMLVRDLMSAPAQTCQPDSDLSAVTHVMWERDCGFVPVVDPAGHVAGVLTDRDICIATATRRLLPEHISAAQVMSRAIHAVLPEDSVEHALITMKQAQVRRLPVIDANGHLQGVVSMNDLVRAVGSKDGPRAADVVATMAALCAPRTVTVAATATATA
jgi:CBS domain-containing protein